MYTDRTGGKFQGRKLSQIGEKYDFRRENFHGLLAFAMPIGCCAPNFAGETFTYSHKTVPQNFLAIQ